VRPRRLAVPLLLFACACAAPPDHGADGAQRLDRAEFALSNAPDPPAPGSPAWEPLSLPDRWRERRPDAGGFAWYRLETPGPVAPGTEWALSCPAST
jgi:hypothetical protein